MKVLLSVNPVCKVTISCSLIIVDLLRTLTTMEIQEDLVGIERDLRGERDKETEKEERGSIEEMERNVSILSGTIEEVEEVHSEEENVNSKGGVEVIKG